MHDTVINREPTGRPNEPEQQNAGLNLVSVIVPAQNAVVLSLSPTMRAATFQRSHAFALNRHAVKRDE
jgi:hypothetical protein